MAKGHFQFRPKDGSILSWLRQEAARDKRSLNSWMEVHFEGLKDSQENPKTVVDIIHEMQLRPRMQNRFLPVLEAIHKGELPPDMCKYDASGNVQPLHIQLENLKAIIDAMNEARPPKMK